MAAAVTGFEIVDAVNAKLPESERFEPLGWYPAKTLRLHREYRRLYPLGRLLRRQGITAAIMLGCLVIVGGLLGFGVLGFVWIGGGGALLLWFTYFRNAASS